MTWPFVSTLNTSTRAAIFPRICLTNTPSDQMKALINGLLASAALGTGCSKVQDVNREFKSDLEIVFYAGGKETGRTKFLAESQQVSNLVHSLQSFEGKWHSDYNSYAPGVMVRMLSGTLNIVSTKLVANLTRNGSSHQYSVSVSPEVSAALIQPLRSEKIKDLNDSKY